MKQGFLISLIICALLLNGCESLQLSNNSGTDLSSAREDYNEELKKATQDLKETAKETAETTSENAQQATKDAGEIAEDMLDWAVNSIKENINEIEEIAETPSSEFSGSGKNVLETLSENDESTKQSALDALKEAISNNVEKDTYKSYQGTTDTTSQTAQAATENEKTATETETETDTEESITDIAQYVGDMVVEINNNIPYFTLDELTTESFETYSELDSLGRVGVAYANIGYDLLPTEERGSIGMFKPTGFINAKYEILIDDDNTAGYIYNRCHELAYSLGGDNSELNLMTGTRAFNLAMETYEMAVLSYIKQNTDAHVLYRSTPIFTDENLVANALLLEAYSVEDGGEGICFNVLIWNVQNGISIDYATGQTSLAN